MEQGTVIFVVTLFVDGTITEVILQLADVTAPFTIQHIA